MSSVIFQPLLHDSIGWKPCNSTYTDAFKWRRHRSTSKDKKMSMYGQRYQKQLQKQQQLKLQQANESSISATLPAENEQKKTQRMTPIKAKQANREHSAFCHRDVPSQTSLTAPVLANDTPVIVAEYQRPMTNLKRAACSSRASQRSSATPLAGEESCRPQTSFDPRRSVDEAKEKISVDLNNDNSRHWLTYPNPKTPQYITDVKQRLGQLKIPSTLVRPASMSCGTIAQQQQQQIPHLIERSESAVSQRVKKFNSDQRHFLDFNLPKTPDELRAARHRIEKHRYNPALDNYPPRPQTCPIFPNETLKCLTPQAVHEPPEEQLPLTETTNTTTTNENAWVSNEENKPIGDENPQVIVQMVDVDGLPSEYVDALEIANAAQEEYMKSLNFNEDNRPDNPVYRLPALPHDERAQSFTAYRNQQQSATPTNNHNSKSTSRADFGTWVRNASDKERESARKILTDVLHQPIMGYDIPKTQQTRISSPTRSKSSTRKLGSTRNHQHIPYEICDKQLIKQHVWNLSRSDALICPQEAQGMKPTTTQSRT